MTETIESVVEKISNLKMYNADIGYYFLDSTYNTELFQNLLVERYTAFWPKEFSKIDSGQILQADDERTAMICALLEISKKETLFCYEQSKGAHFIYTKKGTIVDKADLRVNLDSSPIKVEGIKCTEPLKRLLDDLKRIHPEYVMYRIDNGLKMNHPIKNTKRSECQFYIKMLVAFCNERGFSAAQLQRLTELCSCFGISSYSLKSLFTMISKTPSDIDCRIKLTDHLKNSGYYSDRSVLAVDLLYMIYLGKYDVNTEFNAVLRVGHIMDIDEDAVFTIYDKIKENG